MRVKILRNPGAGLVGQLAADGVTLPEPAEGEEVDLADKVAERLIGIGLAEAVGGKPAHAAAAEAKKPAAAKESPKGDK